MSDAQAARRALALLDLTDLSDTCQPRDIDALCARALGPHGRPAAICIWPQFVRHARDVLGGTGVRVATVVNFPTGDTDSARAGHEARAALRDGADEIDLVMPWRAFLGGDRDGPREMIGHVADITGAEKVLKVILETGGLDAPERIAAASRLAIDAGASFIKTSTGKIAVSATLDAARIMLEAIRATGGRTGFKAAGGVRTLGDAKAYLALADTILGAGWATPATFRFGASGLLDALEAAIGGGAAGREQKAAY